MDPPLERGIGEIEIHIEQSFVTIWSHQGDGSINDPSWTHLLPQEQALRKRIETLEAWVRSYTGGAQTGALGFTMSELEGRLLKRITNSIPTSTDKCARASKSTAGVGIQIGKIVSKRRLVAPEHLRHFQPLSKLAVPPSSSIGGEVAQALSFSML